MIKCEGPICVNVHSVSYEIYQSYTVYYKWMLFVLRAPTIDEYACRIPIKQPCSWNGMLSSRFRSCFIWRSPGSLLDVVALHLVKFRSREIVFYSDCIAQKFHRHLGSVAVKIQNDWKSMNPNLAASRHHEICGKTSVV